MTAPATTIISDLTPDLWHDTVTRNVGAGARFAGVYCAHHRDAAQLHALLIDGSAVACLRTVLTPDRDGTLSYPALTPSVSAAFWYERALHDLSGVTPTGHPRLDPLLLPRDADDPSPRPGNGVVETLSEQPHSEATEHQGPVDVTGRGVFTLPLGPVRSGVFESIEFLIETPGEAIPHLNIRPHYKHRGIAKRFDGLDVSDGILVAERVEGIASVAHALAFAHAVEASAGVDVPPRARLLRVVHAELERIANHLDVVVRLCEAAGLAVPTARFGWHKEAVMRVVSSMCGSRFGRKVVRIGGIGTAPRRSPADVARDLGAITARIAADRRPLMRDASFLDRLRGTGHLDAGLAKTHGALGPIGRASGVDDDARRRGYDGYPELEFRPTACYDACDALARLRVRLDEIDAAADLIRRACDRLTDSPDPELAVPVQPADGLHLGWAEAPQGEVLYGVELRDGVIGRCFARSASLHNMLLFHDVFGNDIFTDFPFIEASFGLSYAGVAM